MLTKPEWPEATVLEEAPDYVVRSVSPSLRSWPEGAVTCWVNRWTPDAARAIEHYRATHLSTPDDPESAAQMLRDITRFASHVIYLQVTRTKLPLDLSPVGDLARLAHLEIKQSPDTLDLSRLTALSRLGLIEVSRYDGIRNAPALDELSIKFSKGLRDLRPFAGSPVRALRLHGVHSLKTLDGAAELPRLEEIDLDVNRGLKSLRALSMARPLRRFSLYGSRGIEDLDAIGPQHELEDFILDNGPVLPSFEMFGEMKSLRTFDLNSSNIGPMATRIAPLALLPDLRELSLRAGPTRGFDAITDIPILGQATRLEALYLDRVAPLKDFSFLSGLTHLRKLQISRTVIRNPDRGPLAGLPLSQ
jgi:hypothetical protein